MRCRNAAPRSRAQSRHAPRPSLTHPSRSSPEQGSHHTVLSTADRSRRSQAGRSAAGSREGTNTDRTVYGAASASASSFVVHHTQQISMAAVAGDAENINKQARKMRTNWVTNKQTADGFLRSAAVEGARTA